MNPYKKCLVCYQEIDGEFYHPKCSSKLFATKAIPSIDFDQKEIDQLAINFINKRFAVPGVQKKLSLSLNSDEIPQRFTIVGYLGGTHILKPPTAEYPHMPEVENLTMLMADKCKIKTSAHGLIAMKDQSLAYITKRFDRDGKKKIAVEDLCQLSEMTTEQKDKSTAERLGKVIRHYSSNPGDDALRYFEMTLFAFLSGNADMHLKNFSMMTNDLKCITLSPAYDLLSTRLLISEHDDPEELTLSVQGKKSSLKRTNFIFLGQNLQIQQVTIDRTLDFFMEQEAILVDTIEQSILPEILKKQFVALLRTRIDRIRI